MLDMANATMYLLPIYEQISINNLCIPQLKTVTY
jgi:hypothetical protein